MSTTTSVILGILATIFAALIPVYFSGRQKLRLSVKTGKVGDSFGYDSTPKYKQIQALVTNLGKNDVYLKVANLRLKKGHSEILITKTGTELFRHRAIKSGETKTVRFSPERIDNELVNDAHALVRVEIITSTDRRFVSNYAQLLFMDNLEV